MARIGKRQPKPLDCHIGVVIKILNDPLLDFHSRRERFIPGCDGVAAGHELATRKLDGDPVTLNHDGFVCCSIKLVADAETVFFEIGSNGESELESKLCMGISSPDRDYG